MVAQGYDLKMAARFRQRGVLKRPVVLILHPRLRYLIFSFT